VENKRGLINRTLRCGSFLHKQFLSTPLTRVVFGWEKKKGAENISSHAPLLSIGHVAVGTEYGSQGAEHSVLDNLLALHAFF